MSRALILVAGVPMLFAFAPQEQPAAVPGAAAADENCLSQSRVLTRRAEGPTSLRFEMNDGTVYLNEVQGRCRSLERANNFDILSFDLTGSQYCRGDRFRVVDPAQAGAVGLRAFPECRLGSFVRAEAASPR